MSIAQHVRRTRTELEHLRLCVGSGILGIMPPQTLLRGGRAVRDYGSMAGLLGMSAARYPERTAIIDERGSLTFEELNLRSHSLANAWRERGLAPGEGVAILARNHRGLLEATFAAAKCGARIVLLNTDFAGPQIRDVATREGTDLLVYDEEYASMLAGVVPPRGAYRAWTETAAADSLEALIASGSREAPPAPGVAPKIILLTSGTTGTPKGAPRPEPRSLAPFGALLSKVPFRSREVTEICAPMFHTLGFAHAMAAIAFGSTIVVRRRFDPQAAFDSLARHRATAMVVVPVMLQRLLDLGADARTGRDLSSLRIVFVAGSQLGADLATRALDALGPVIYNMYGSTEVAYATIATPSDLRAAPGCVGGPVLGAVVKVFGDDGAELPTGRTGRVFVGNGMQFEGYTGGGGKDALEGLLASGDVGHFDSAGRLYIDGRDDDMIVSGGENVFPAEVEELLHTHAAVREAAVVGVPDEKFGARLKAFVVLHDSELLVEGDLRDYVRANLARYKVPREITFLDELPRNPTGKVLKRKLQEL